MIMKAFKGVPILGDNCAKYKCVYGQRILAQLQTNECGVVKNDHQSDYIANTADVDRELSMLPQSPDRAEIYEAYATIF